MKRYGSIVLLLLLLWPSLAFAQESGPLLISAGQREPGSVATVSRDIRVEGAVDGDVTSWSGSITVLGTVGGDVVSYSGTVTIAPGAQVQGHVLASGDDLQVAEGATVAGQRIQSAGGSGALASLLDLFVQGDRSATPAAVGQVLFGGTAGVLLAAFCALFIAFWPRRTQVAASALAAAPARAIALGALTSGLLALVLLPLSALLLASVLGAPLLLALLLALLGAYAYGLAVLARLAGGWLARRAGAPPGALPFLAALALVLPIVLIAAFAPLWGAALFAALALPGLGAAIMTRGGMLALPELAHRRTV